LQHCAVIRAPFLPLSGIPHKPPDIHRNQYATPLQYQAFEHFANITDPGTRIAINTLPIPEQ
jgi:hypothetical protein